VWMCSRSWVMWHTRRQCFTMFSFLSTQSFLRHFFLTLALVNFNSTDRVYMFTCYMYLCALHTYVCCIFFTTTPNNQLLPPGRYAIPSKNEWTVSMLSDRSVMQVAESVAERQSSCLDTQGPEFNPQQREKRKEIQWESQEVFFW
jgi:hypothetical protein